MALALALGACAQPPASPPPPQAPAAQGGTQAFAARVPELSAFVVEVSTLRLASADAPEAQGEPDTEFAPELDYVDRLGWPRRISALPGEVRDLASGFVLAADGLILTSAHVLSQVDEAQVTLADGRRFAARVLGVDRRSDVALLKIDATGLPVAPLGNSRQLRPGDWVAAISAPFGLRGSVTAGVVSAKGRTIPGAGDIPFVQTDVAINPGSSGSPLFDARGQVVAVNSMIYSGTGGYMGLAFAVPIELALKVAQQLQRDGQVRRAWLGAEFQDVTPALAQAFRLPAAAGALLVRADPDGPALGAGLRRGDVIVGWDDAPVAHAGQLLEYASDAAPGSRARLDLWRQGARRMVTVSLGELRQPARAIAAAPQAEWFDGLGLRLTELTEDRLRQLGLDGALLVREVAGLARSEGLRVGDLLVALDEQPLRRVADFTHALAQAPADRPVALLVMREHRMAYLPIRVPRAAVQPASRPRQP